MSRKKLTRREFLGLSTMAGAGAVLSACGVASSPSAASSLTSAPSVMAPIAAATPVDLRFAWWGGQQRADVTTQIIKTFETKHPNVKFAFEPRGGLLDVMQYGSSSPTGWTTGTIDFGNIPNILRTHKMVDGKIYGVSTGANANGFVADVDAFEEAGIEVPAGTWTWNDFDNVVKKLHTNLSVWGFGMFLHHDDSWKLLSLMSLGDCSCASCRAMRYPTARVLSPTPLQRSMAGV